MPELSPMPTEPEPLLQRSTFALKRWLRVDLLGLFAIFVVFYFFKLSTFSLSIDDEMEALQASSRVWVLTGRWAGYFFDQYLLPQSTIPYLPIFLFGAFATVAYPVLLAAFDVKRLRDVHYLTFPFFVAFPTWSFLAAFAANIASAGVGLLCVAGSVLMFRRAIDRTAAGESIRSYARTILLGALYLAVAVGFYQSFVFAFLVLSFAVILQQWGAGRGDLRFLLRCALVLVALFVAAVVTYEIADTALRDALNLKDRSYLANFADWRTLMQSPLQTGLRVIGSMTHVYGGFTEVYGLRAFSFPLLILAGLTAIAWIPAKTAGRRLVALLLTAAIVCIPFLQHFLAGGDMPLRTLVGVPCVFWFFALAALTAARSRLAGVAFAIVLVALFQILYSSALLQTSNYLVRVHDQQLSSTIYAQIVAAHPDFNTNTTYPVDFYGAKKFDTTYPRPFSSTGGYSFFEWGSGDSERITNYMRLIGYSNLRPVAAEQRQRDRAVFAQMPIWPAQGSVRAVDGVTLVKLDSQSTAP